MKRARQVPASLLLSRRNSVFQAGGIPSSEPARTRVAAPESSLLHCRGEGGLGPIGDRFRGRTGSPAAYETEAGDDQRRVTDGGDFIVGRDTQVERNEDGTGRAQDAEATRRAKRITVGRTRSSARPSLWHGEFSWRPPRRISHSTTEHEPKHENQPEATTSPGGIRRPSASSSSRSDPCHECGRRPTHPCPSPTRETSRRDPSTWRTK